MKKVVCGVIMFLAGLVSSAILLAGTVCTQWTLNGELASALWILSQHGLMPAFFVFAAIAVIGLVTSLVGIFEKE